MTGPGWRVVAVLLAANDGAAAAGSRILQARLAPYTPRIYRTGPHLVVVATVRAASAAHARVELGQCVTGALPAGTDVADIWSGRSPVAFAA